MGSIGRVNWRGHAGGPSTFHAATENAMLNRIVRARPVAKHEYALSPIGGDDHWADENDEGKSTFCEIGLQFRPCNMQAENYPKIRRCTVIYCSLIT